jgi:ATP-dependent Lon protease
MFRDLPEIFHESALIDRFHGFIKGWHIPRMKENLKVNGWAINMEYFGEIIHLLRGEVIYRGVVDELLAYPKNADTRDTEAIKRMCTAFLKLFFPNVRNVNAINRDEFVQYCLEPAIGMRQVIKNQLGIIDPEYAGKSVPHITLKDIP